VFKISTDGMESDFYNRVRKLEENKKSFPFKIAQKWSKSCAFFESLRGLNHGYRAKKEFKGTSTEEFREWPQYWYFW